MKQTPIVALRLDPGSITDVHMKQINELLKNCSKQSEPLKKSSLESIANTSPLVVLDAYGAIVGMAVLILYRRPSAYIGLIEDLFVAESFLNAESFEKIYAKLMDEASKAEVERISRYLNWREAFARQNNLETEVLRKLGFSSRDIAPKTYFSRSA